MKQNTITQAGRFHQGRQSDGRPEALNAWRVTTNDADVALGVAELLGGEPQPNEGGGDLAHEVLTKRDSLRVIVDGPDALTAHWVLWSNRKIIHKCDGSLLLSPEEKNGEPCGCPPLLADKKLAARDGRGPTPSITLAFRLAAAPTLGEFHFMTSSWQVASQLPELTNALESVEGPAVCDLAMELVTFTTKSGRAVAYRKPVVTVLGHPESVAPEPLPATPPQPAPATSPSRRENRSPEPAPSHSVPDLTCLVSADGDLLRRAADVLGTSSHQATVTAALREVVARQQQNRDLARLRDQVERIAVIAGQALRGRDTSDT